MSELIITGITGVCGNVALTMTAGQSIRDEVSAWVTLVGSIAITLTTIGLQVYHMIRDRDKDKNTNADAPADEKDEDSNGKVH